MYDGYLYRLQLGTVATGFQPQVTFIRNLTRDVPATPSTFTGADVSGIAFDYNDTMYVAHKWGVFRIVKSATTGYTTSAITEWVGLRSDSAQSGGAAISRDGTGTSARLSWVRQLEASPDRTTLYTLEGRTRVRSIDVDTAVLAVTMSHITCEAIGKASCMEAIAVDPAGNLWSVPRDVGEGEDDSDWDCALRVFPQSLLATSTSIADELTVDAARTMRTFGLEGVCATMGSANTRPLVDGPLASTPLYAPRVVAFHPGLPGTAFVAEHPRAYPAITSANYDTEYSWIIRVLHGFSIEGSPWSWNDTAAAAAMPAFLAQRVSAASLLGLTSSQDDILANAVEPVVSDVINYCLDNLTATLATAAGWIGFPGTLPPLNSPGPAPAPAPGPTPTPTPTPAPGPSSTPSSTCTASATFSFGVNTDVTAGAASIVLPDVAKVYEAVEEAIQAGGGGSAGGTAGISVSGAFSLKLSTLLGIPESVWTATPEVADIILRTVAQEINVPRDLVAVLAVRRADTNAVVASSSSSSSSSGRRTEGAAWRHL